MKKKIAGLPDAEYITPTKEDLERRFKEYNEKYFDGVLPPCKFTVVRMKKHSSATYFIKEQKIRIAKNVYWTNETLKLTLIHEMVHHYVKTRLNYTPNFFSHGRRYRKVCRMLRKKHGLKVNLYELPLEHWKGEKKTITPKRSDVSFYNFDFTFLITFDSHALKVVLEGLHVCH